MLVIGGCFRPVTLNHSEEFGGQKRRLARCLAMNPDEFGEMHEYGWLVPCH